MMLKAFLLLAFIVGISDAWIVPQPQPYVCTPTGYYGGAPHEYRCYLKNDGFSKRFECQGPFNIYVNSQNEGVVISNNPTNSQKN
ncbi:hypothetical protein QR680_014466 [Steinernema hermaphroditum]|uniref:Secreted protein n=1 Tax=Steinernema hermaphroditum TaxID=289476 RepID=A0AA39I8Z0_9BILA|nr:hypothetical protein QR680_014466 [Steinernema hermaphroditum]